MAEQVPGHKQESTAKSNERKEAVKNHYHSLPEGAGQHKDDLFRNEDI